MPEWIIHTPRLTTRSGIRRSVVVTRLAARSAISSWNGHQWNHSNSVISNGRHCRSWACTHASGWKMFGCTGYRMPAEPTDM